MKTIKTFTLISFITSLIFLWGCDPGTSTGGSKVPPVVNGDTAKLYFKQIRPKRVEGGKYPAAKLNLKEPLNDADKPFVVPKGPEPVIMKPANPEFKIEALKGQSGGGSQAPLYYNVNEDISDAVPIGHTLTPEPSVAENGQTVIHTGNFWMSLSLDAGLTFNSVNPSTIFPEDWGGFHCDQVVTYVPKYDLFVWLLQYRADNNGVNGIRIAVQSTEMVRNSNGTAWTYWDFSRTIFGNNGILDYNDMSFGNDFLYWTSSVGGGSHRYVIRVPLKELQAKSTVSFQYTGSTDAYWSHVTQNGRNGVYWAGHKDNSTMLVYSMMDVDGFYSWREVSINSWPNDRISSIAANGTDWLDDTWWKTYVRAAAIKGNSAFFAWNASSSNNFPQPHIQIVEINTNNFTMVNQMQIWNPDFAFAYPYFEMNAEGELGMIVAFGGDNYNASSGVGVWGDFVIYYPRLGSQSQTYYGHYHTLRRSGSDPLQWVGAGYTNEADGSILPYYLKISR